MIAWAMNLGFAASPSQAQQGSLGLPLRFATGWLLPLLVTWTSPWNSG